MKNKYPKSKLFEQLADIEHQRWSDWQKYFHATLLETMAGENRAVILNQATIDCLQRWLNQANTPYKDLSEKEKDSDRDQVMRYWHLISPTPRRLNKWGNLWN